MHIDMYIHSCVYVDKSSFENNPQGHQTGHKNLDQPSMHKHINTYINVELYLSTDIDECANDSIDDSDDGSTEGSQNGCNQICTNTNGSFYCECFSGYQLSDDMMTCVGM